MRTPPIGPYYGGKYNAIGRFIANHLPAHKNYVELFGGLAGVLMQKERSFVEVYNDLNDDLVNLFRIIRDPEQLEKLTNQLSYTPYSRLECKEAQADLSGSPIERARRTYVALNMGYIGSLKRSDFSFGGPKYETSVGRSYRNAIDNLPAIHERLKEVIVENYPAVKLVDQWDSKDTLFYADPPYVLSTRRTKNDYVHEMTDADHESLLDKLVRVKGNVIISGYSSDLYNDILIPAGFETIETPTSSAVSRSNIYSKGAARTEVLWHTSCIQIKKNQLSIFDQILTKS